MGPWGVPYMGVPYMGGTLFQALNSWKKKNTENEHIPNTQLRYGIMVYLVTFTP